MDSDENEKSKNIKGKKYIRRRRKKTQSDTDNFTEYLVIRKSSQTQKNIINELRSQSTQIIHSTFNNNLICFHSLLWTFCACVSHHFTGLKSILFVEFHYIYFFLCCYFLLLLPLLIVLFLLPFLSPFFLLLFFFFYLNANEWSDFATWVYGQFVDMLYCLLVYLPSNAVFLYFCWAKLKWTYRIGNHLSG